MLVIASFVACSMQSESEELESAELEDSLKRSIMEWRFKRNQENTDRLSTSFGDDMSLQPGQRSDKQLKNSLKRLGWLFKLSAIRLKA